MPERGRRFGKARVHVKWRGPIESLASGRQVDLERAEQTPRLSILAHRAGTKPKESWRDGYQTRGPADRCPQSPQNFGGREIISIAHEECLPSRPIMASRPQQEVGQVADIDQTALIVHRTERQRNSARDRL